MIKLGEMMMILDLHRQGLSVSAIAKATGADRKTVRKYIARGLEPPAYGPRKPRQAVIDPFTSYLRERVARYPGLTGRRLFRELKDRGYSGGYTAVTDFLRDIRPAAAARGFEVRFETPPGEQAQVDFAQFQVVFTDEPTAPRIVWLFSMVLGFSRLIWARFVVHQDLPTVLRGRGATMTHDYKRNGTTTLFAALNILDGSVIGRNMQRHRHQEFIRFLNVVEAELPQDKAVHVILDNYATHKQPKVRAWLERHPRWTFHFVPTSCSWLNAVEGFFAKLTRRRLKNGVFHSVVDLQAAINRFITEHNQEPRPFIWRAGPDQIIAAVKRGHQTLESIH